MEGNLTIFIMLVSCLHVNAVAQEATKGIYLSTDDFNRNKISFSKSEGKKYRLHLNELLNSCFVKIIIGDSLVKLKKDSVFGYRDDRNKIYRFYRNSTYGIINPSEKILLYYQSSLGGYRGHQMITHYFFSVNADSPLIPLTIQNLKIAFTADPQFQEMLILYFSKDTELISFDSYNKMYKLNHIYQLSLQSKLKSN